VYANTLLDVLFQSPAKKKFILIAGGVANFTDVLGTFQGIVDAFRDNAVRLKEAGVFVCVRRGGPNQEAGLAYLRDFLTEKGITCDVRGPELSLGDLGVLVKKQLI
jgi:succinyl-CoA synthetase beta subunit